MLKWSEIRILERVLREKYVYVYIWGINGLYFIQEGVKHAALLPEWLLSIASVLPSGSLPTFVILGFLQGISYYVASHIFHQAAPEFIAKDKPEHEAMAYLDTEREKLVQSTDKTVRDIYQIKKSLFSGNIEVISTKIGSSEAVDLVEEFSQLAFLPEKEKIVNEAEERARLLTYDGQNASLKMYRVICSLLFLLSGIFWLAHVLKLFIFIIR